MVCRNVSGKVCAVFGGSRGIGKAVCEELARRGANVAVISRDKNGAAECANGLQSKACTDQHFSLACDIRCQTSIQNSIKCIQNRFGDIDILVNAAGVNNDNLLLKSKPEEIENTIKTNLKGPIYTSQAIVKSMLKRKSGVIINIGSIVGIKGNIGQCVYATSKSGE